MMWYLLSAIIGSLVSAIIGGYVGGWILYVFIAFDDDDKSDHERKAAATVSEWIVKDQAVNIVGKGAVNNSPASEYKIPAYNPVGDWRNAAQEVDKQEMGAINPEDISSTTVKIDASDLNWGVTRPCGVMVDDPWAAHNKIHHIEGRHDH